MSAPPQNVRAHKAEKTLEIVWSDATTDRFPFKLLRAECPCASCVNEFTGERMIDPNRIADDIEPTDLSLVGNYAVKITWTDGHDTGLFRWDYLSWLAERYELRG